MSQMSYDCNKTLKHHRTIVPSCIGSLNVDQLCDFFVSRNNPCPFLINCVYCLRLLYSSMTPPSKKKPKQKTKKPKKPKNKKQHLALFSL